jgi:hypothetical protein
MVTESSGHNRASSMWIIHRVALYIGESVSVVMTLSKPDIGIIMFRMSLIRFVILMLQIWLFRSFGIDVVGIIVAGSGRTVVGCLV